jgi:hypothetical protein
MDFKVTKAKKKIQLTVKDPKNDSENITLFWSTDLSEDDLKFDRIVYDRFNANSDRFKTRRIKGSGTPHRFGSLVNLNDSTYWNLNLISRALKKKSDLKTNLTIPKIIDFTIYNTLKLDDRSNTLNELVGSKEIIQENLNQINKYFDRYLLIDNKVESLSLPKLTYHPIPAIRNLYLLLVEPELIDYEDIISINQTFNEFNEFKWTSQIVETNNSLERERQNLVLRGVRNNMEEVQALRLNYKRGKTQMEKTFKEFFNPSDFVEFLQLKDVDFKLAYENIKEEDRQLELQIEEIVKETKRKEKTDPVSRAFFQKAILEDQRSQKKFLMTRYNLDEIFLARDHLEQLKEIQKRIAIIKS